jgi:hypothetical protein
MLGLQPLDQLGGGGRCGDAGYCVFFCHGVTPPL